MDELPSHRLYQFTYYSDFSFMAKLTILGEKFVNLFLKSIWIIVFRSKSILFKATLLTMSFTLALHKLEKLFNSNLKLIFDLALFWWHSTYHGFPMHLTLLHINPWTSLFGGPFLCIVCPLKSSVEKFSK